LHLTASPREFNPLELDNSTAIVHFLLNGQKKVYCFLGEKQGKPYLTFFLSDEKESKQRKNRRHRFIGQFFLYTNGVNLNTLFTSCLLNYMAFSSSHPVLIQKPRRNPLRRSKLLLYVIAVNTLCL